MSIKYEIEPRKGVILTTVSGTVTEEEVTKYLGEVFLHPKRGHPYREIFDLRDVTKFDVDMEGARRIVAFAKHYQAHWENGQVALVAPRDYEFGMARVIGAYADDMPFEFRVFRNMNDAKAWIELD
ncbi:MAG: STAS/SEC14 domain-containing protein [Candidatus Krumholzibacteria bacterium]|nr:STAS/SEC14 domain-containing protein [Candidatus Krumholzibacteria bacterium]